MGVFQHDAILITTDSVHADLIARFCDEVTLPLIRDVKRTSGFVTLLVPPDGGKEGWETSDLYNPLRKQLVEFLKIHTAAWCSWVQVNYGERGAYVITSSEE